MSDAPKGLTRREALTLMLLSAVAAAGGSPRHARAGDALLMREIPSTGEKLPAVGLGTSTAFETGAGADLEPLREVLRQFVALGGRLVDTSPMYSNAEDNLGRLIGELEIADQLFMATKVWTRGAEDGIAQMERSEQRLGMRPLDLIQVHNLVDLDTQLNTLYRWKEEGRVRYVGITHYRNDAFDDLAKIMRREPLDFVQFNYSVLNPEAENDLLPLAADRGIATLINRPFQDGRLFRITRGRKLPAWAKEFDCESWAQFSLKFIVSHPAVTCAIPATSKPKHLVDNMHGGMGRLPEAKTRRRMLEYMASL